MSPKDHPFMNSVVFISDFFYVFYVCCKWNISECCFLISIMPGKEHPSSFSTRIFKLSKTVIWFYSLSSFILQNIQLNRMHMSFDFSSMKISLVCQTLLQLNGKGCRRHGQQPQEKAMRQQINQDFVEYAPLADTKPCHSATWLGCGCRHCVQNG